MPLSINGISGAAAITHDDIGRQVVPSHQADWLDWVSATATQNFLLNDPLLDWLDEYGEDHGFRPDSKRFGYDQRTDFTEFIVQKARAFESAVCDYLETLTTVHTIATHGADAYRLEKAEQTLHAMEAGVPIIYQGVLRDPENLTYGIPDILIRSDELAHIFPGAIADEEAAIPGPALRSAGCHYRVIDIKFTTVHLLAGGELGNTGSSPAYKGQLYIYNRALGRIQGYLSPTSYLLGRAWAQTRRGVTSRGQGCAEKLGPVDHVESELGTVVEQAVAWRRRLLREGKSWSVLPSPTVPELRPNMGAVRGGRWNAVKHEIAQELQELTTLWYVGVEKRRAANARGIYCWSDPRCTAEALGVTGSKTRPVLQAILDINRGVDPGVAPHRVTAASQEWHRTPELEFYVDFETVSDLDDDFSQIPTRGGQPMIFMIGCGHVEDGDWKFKSFTADALTEPCEAAIIDDWLAHMREVRARLSRSGREPLLLHWSPAETSDFEEAYNASKKRHAERARDWPELRWFDFLGKVVKEEPVVVRGAWGFGLKAIAQAMHAQGLITTRWASGPTDGLGAMVGAWWCAREAATRKVRLGEIDLMQGIQRYNEIDCSAMMEIVRYLRTHHTEQLPVSEPKPLPQELDLYTRPSGDLMEIVLRDVGVGPVDEDGVWRTTLDRWLKEEGDAVTTGEPLAMISDWLEEKEIVCPGDGVLTKIVAENDCEIEAGSVLGLLRPDQVIEIMLPEIPGHPGNSRREINVLITPVGAEAIDARSRARPDVDWILEWLRFEGNSLKVGEILAELHRVDGSETIDIFSPVDGVLTRIVTHERIVLVGSIIALMQGTASRSAAWYRLRSEK